MNWALNTAAKAVAVSLTVIADVNSSTLGLPSAANWLALTVTAVPSSVPAMDMLTTCESATSSTIFSLVTPVTAYVSPSTNLSPPSICDKETVWSGLEDNTFSKALIPEALKGTLGYVMTSNSQLPPIFSCPTKPEEAFTFASHISATRCV